MSDVPGQLGKRLLLNDRQLPGMDEGVGSEVQVVLDHRHILEPRAQPKRGQDRARRYKLAQIRVIFTCLAIRNPRL